MWPTIPVQPVPPQQEAEERAIKLATLKSRFPKATPPELEKVLDEQGGHAGKAAAVLSSVYPDNVELFVEQAGGLEGAQGPVGPTVPEIVRECTCLADELWREDALKYASTLERSTSRMAGCHLIYLAGFCTYLPVGCAYFFLCPCSSGMCSGCESFDPEAPEGCLYAPIVCCCGPPVDCCICAYPAEKVPAFNAYSFRNIAVWGMKVGQLIDIDEERATIGWAPASINWAAPSSPPARMKETLTCYCEKPSGRLGLRKCIC